WAVAVVVRDVVDLAAVDPALVVDHVEIGAGGLADRAVGRRRAGVRHDVADLDLRVRDARPVFLGLGREREQGERSAHKKLLVNRKHANWVSLSRGLRAGWTGGADRPASPHPLSMMIRRTDVKTAGPGPAVFT